jgi:hypothetical protein
MSFSSRSEFTGGGLKLPLVQSAKAMYSGTAGAENSHARQKDI